MQLIFSEQKPLFMIATPRKWDKGYHPRDLIAVAIRGPVFLWLF